MNSVALLYVHKEYTFINSIFLFPILARQAPNRRMWYVQDAMTYLTHRSELEFNFTSLSCGLASQIPGKLQRPIPCPIMMNYDVVSGSQFGSWGNEGAWEQMQAVMLTWSALSWHEFPWVESTKGTLMSRSHMIRLCDASAHLKSTRTCMGHASTVPPHANSTAQASSGQLYWCHNLDEPMRTLITWTRNIWC